MQHKPLDIILRSDEFHVRADGLEVLAGECNFRCFTGPQFSLPFPSFRFEDEVQFFLAILFDDERPVGIVRADWGVDFKPTGQFDVHFYLNFDIIERVRNVRYTINCLQRSSRMYCYDNCMIKQANEQVAVFLSFVRSFFFGQLLLDWKSVMAAALFEYTVKFMEDVCLILKINIRDVIMVTINSFDTPPLTP